MRWKFWRRKSSFGELVRQRRLALGMRQIDLANKIGVTGSHIGHIENGRRIPSKTLSEAIANTLGIKAKEYQQ